MVVCEMTGAQADMNASKHAMGMIFLIIIGLTFGDHVFLDGLIKFSLDFCNRCD
jgi:hypothetical protein